MTTPATQALLPVGAEDREAAAQWLRSVHSVYLALWIEGRGEAPEWAESQNPDDYSLVQAFARHRRSRTGDVGMREALGQNSGPLADAACQIAIRYGVGGDGQASVYAHTKDALLAALTPSALSEKVVKPGFQAEVGDWMLECFGPEIAADRLERGDRWTEEALELAQTIPGFTAERAHALVDYVFARPVGERGQEVGGSMVTLAALCNSFGINIAEEAERELARVWTKVEAIRAKQAAKPTGSALPVAVASALSGDAGEARECPNSPSGKHQVDTSMEEGPHHCFHCSVNMRAAHKGAGE